MLKVQDVLADTAVSLPELFGRFLVGFDDDNRTATTEHLPNHMIWSLGHVSLYLSRIAEHLDGQPLPEEDFVAGDGNCGSPECYDTESIAFDSQPDVDAERFPTVERAKEIFAAACERLATALRGASDEKLESTIEWAGQPITLWALTLRVMNHCGFHAGQIADLRRALGLGRVMK
jgi:hypothetical protein